MPAPDFPYAQIEVNEGTFYWGPFAFDFPISPTPAAPGAIPYGDTLISAVVTSIGPNGIDSTSQLISPESVLVSGSIVTLRLQYPGGMSGKHVLFFELYFASSATQKFKFDGITVT